MSEPLHSADLTIASVQLNGATVSAGAGNTSDLSALVGDPNVSIHEAKAFVCRVEKG